MLYIIVNTKKTPSSIVMGIQEKMNQEWPQLSSLSDLGFIQLGYKHFIVFKSNYFKDISINLLINLDENDQSDIAELFNDDNTQWTYNRYIGCQPINNLRKHDGAIVALHKDQVSVLVDFFSFFIVTSYNCVDANDYLTITQNKILYYLQTDNLIFKLKFGGRCLSQSVIAKYFNMVLFVYKIYESEFDTITMDDIGEAYDRVHKKWPNKNLNDSSFIYSTLASLPLKRFGLYWEAQSCLDSTNVGDGNTFH